MVIYSGKVENRVLNNITEDLSAVKDFKKKLNSYKKFIFQINIYRGD